MEDGALQTLLSVFLPHPYIEIRPSKGSPRTPVHLLERDGPVKLELVKGFQVQEARQIFADWATVVYRCEERAREGEE